MALICEALLVYDLYGGMHWYMHRLGPCDDHVERVRVRALAHHDLFTSEVDDVRYLQNL